MSGKNRNIYLFVIAVSATLFLLITVYTAAETPKASRLGVSAKAAILYEPETGSFLYSKNADTRLPMASTTKIMTALVAIENASLSDLVEIDPSAVGIEGSSAYLQAGDILTMEELLYALLLRSANDAAVAIACYVGGSVEDFADMMNAKAEAFGLENTHFVNPNGLDHKEHYTSARDLAIIAAEALKNDTFKKICSTYKKSFVRDDKNILYVNHNKLLNMYDGALGMKTGYTKKSGRCLVGAAERDGLTFITVTLDAPDDWRDHKEMFELGFSSLEKIQFANSGDFSYTLPVVDGKSDSVDITNELSECAIVKRGEHEVKEYIKLSKFAVAPIKKGEIFGEVIFTLDGEVASTLKLTAKEDIPLKNDKNFFEKLLEKLGI